MAAEVNTILWPWDGLGFVRRYVREFDIGELRLPFEGRFAPLPAAHERWLPGVGGLFGIAGGVGLFWLAAERLERLRQILLADVFGVAFVLGGALFVLPLLLGARRQMTIRIDRQWVEVDDRPPLWRRRHWREPLAHYTGVRRHEMALKTANPPGIAPAARMAVVAIDLDHPDAARVVPLLRTDDAQAAERRWSALAAALDKPMTE